MEEADIIICLKKKRKTKRISKKQSKLSPYNKKLPKSIILRHF